MSDSTPNLFGVGRSADVYDRGDGTVLRTYRSGRSCEDEGRIMTWLGSQGIAVPKVHSAKGPDLVMDLVKGPTMLDDLAQRPWMLPRHARTMARLQKQVNDVAAPRWLERREGVQEGNAVLHLDLHPMNILLSPTGPVLIDWPNASRGHPNFDAAMTYVLGAAFEANTIKDRVGKRVLVETFAWSRGRSAVKDGLQSAVTYRLDDPNVTEGERVALEKMLR